MPATLLLPDVNDLSLLDKISVETGKNRLDGYGTPERILLSGMSYGIEKSTQFLPEENGGFAVYWNSCGDPLVGRALFL